MSHAEEHHPVWHPGSWLGWAIDCCLLNAPTSFFISISFSSTRPLNKKKATPDSLLRIPYFLEFFKIVGLWCATWIVLLSVWGNLRGSQVTKAILFDALGNSQTLHKIAAITLHAKDLINTKEIVQLKYSTKHGWNKSN